MVKRKSPIQRKLPLKPKSSVKRPRRKSNVIGGGLTESETKSSKIPSLPPTMLRQILLSVSDEGDLARICATNHQMQTICEEPTFKAEWSKKHAYIIKYTSGSGRSIKTLYNLHSYSVVAQLAKDIGDAIRLPLISIRLIKDEQVIWNPGMLSKYQLLEHTTQTLKQLGIKNGDTVHFALVTLY